jgi:hypothetical protein
MAFHRRLECDRSTLSQERISTDHHFGRFEIKECPVGASSLFRGESKAPRTNATTGASSIAPIVEPQALQKARLEKSEER